MAGKSVFCFISGILLFSIIVPVCLADEDSEINKQKENIYLLIDAGKFAEAKAATDKMTVEYPGQTKLPDMLFWIAARYQQVESFDNAKQIYEQVIRDFPDSPWAGKAKLSNAQSESMSLIVSGKYTDAKAAIDKMASDFAGNTDLPTALYWSAVKFNQIDRFDEAKQVYQKIVDNFPDSPWAGKAKFCITRADATLLIINGDYQKASNALDKLISDFTGNSDLPEAVYWIAERYERLLRTEDAKKTYQRVIDLFPYNTFAKRAKLGISRADATNLVESKDYNNANTAIDKMVSDFATNPDLPETLYWLAERYKAQNRTAEAVRLNQIIVQKYPASPWAGKGNLNLTREKIISLIASQNYELSKAALDKFMTDFAGNPQLPEAIFWIAERYQRFDRFDDAKQIFQQIIDKFPNSPWADKSKTWLSRINVLSLIVAQDYDNAKAALAQFTTGFANTPDFPEAIYWIAERYERQGKTDDAQALCQKIITDYPASQWVTKAKAGHPSGNDVVQDASTIVDIKADTNSVAVIKDVNLNPDLEKAAVEIYRVARGYEEANDYDSADKAYEQVVRDYPATIKGSNAVLDIRRLGILNALDSNDTNQADILLSQYVEDFNLTPYAGECLELLVDKCYLTASQLRRQYKSQEANSRFAFAENVLQIMIDKKTTGNSTIGNADSLAGLYFYAAGCRQNQQKWDGAIKYFQKVVDNYPDFQYAWNAQAAIGWCYEEIRDLSQAPKEAINPLAEEAYKTVLEKYPGCTMAYYAAYRLGELSVQKDDNASAIVYYKKFLELAQKDDIRVDKVKAKIASLEESK